MYKPDKHHSEARVLTPQGWLTGTFHVLGRLSLVDHLNKSGAFVTMTGVTFEGSRHQHLSLRRDAVLMVLPGDDEVEAAAAVPANHCFQAMRFLVQRGELVGFACNVKGRRASDYIAKAEDFIQLVRCTLRSERAHPAMQEFPVVIVRTLHAFAAGEADGPAPEPDLVGAGQASSAR